MLYNKHKDTVLKNNEAQDGKSHLSDCKAHPLSIVCAC